MDKPAAVVEGPDLAVGVALEELVERVPLLGHVAEEPVMLLRRGSEVSAFGGLCPHWHLSLKDARIVGETIRCPWHHACFHLDTGAALGGPALDPLPRFAVIQEGDRVRVGAVIVPVGPSSPPREPSSVVIVGAGAAGVACAVALRVEGYVGALTLVGDEAPVDRPNLSKDYLTGKAEAAWMPLRPPAFYEAAHIDLVLDDPVAAIDPAAHTVRLRGGRSLSYGALVLATGAEPITLSIPGADLPHVSVLRTLADADGILKRSRTARSAVVIGASFIGLEVAASLRERGLRVTIVAPEPVPLGVALGDEVGSYVRTLHEAKGVTFRLGARPARIDAHTVTLDDGTELEADLVVVGVGVKPRAALAEAAGLITDRGIVTDLDLRSSEPDIYAAGDVCRFPDGGALVRIEHWVVAMNQGRAIARTLLGRGKAERDVPFFWSQHYGVVISVVGRAEGWDRAEVNGQIAHGDATIAYRRGARIVAVATIGRASASLAAEEALQRGDQSALERVALGRDA